MPKKNAILDKSFQFSIRIVKLYKYLIKEHKEFVLQSSYFEPVIQLAQMLMRRKLGKVKLTLSQK
jgi:hypothetical protein